MPSTRPKGIRPTTTHNQQHRRAQRTSNRHTSNRHQRLNPAGVDPTALRTGVAKAALFENRTTRISSHGPFPEHTRHAKREPTLTRPIREAPILYVGLVTMDGSVRYFAAVESVADDAEGDGAEWLRGLYAEWFPDAVRTPWGSSTSSTPPSTCGRRRAPVRPGQRPREAVDDAAVPAPQGGPRRRGAGGAAQGRRYRECARAAGYIAQRRGQMRYGEYPRARPAHRLGPGRGGLQDGRRTAHEVHRHALVRGRGEPCALGPLRAPERLVRRLLGPLPDVGRMTRLVFVYQRSVVHPNPIRTVDERAVRDQDTKSRGHQIESGTILARTSNCLNEPDHLNLRQRPRT